MTRLARTSLRETRQRIVAWYLEQDQACRDRFLALRGEFRYPGLTDGAPVSDEPPATTSEPANPQ